MLSGTPITAGTYNATVTAANGVSPSASDTFTIVVNPTLAITPASGPQGTSISVQGAGYTPGELVKTSYKTGLTAPPKAAVCSATATSSGTFTCNGSIPTAPTSGPTGSHKSWPRGRVL